MADIQKTIERFGYDPRNLRPSSCKPVIVTCPVCLKDREKPARLARQVTCLACSNAKNARTIKGRESRSVRMMKFYADGGKHPLAGIGHSEESRKKISKSRTGMKLDLSDDTRKRLARHCMEVLNNPETKERTASLNRKRTGPLSPSYGKPAAHAFKVWYKGVCFRSTWEFKFATWLDCDGKMWVYEPRAYPVSYELNGKNKDGTYTPDFESEGVLHEIKGRWTKEGKAKFLAFREQYPDIRIELWERERLTENLVL
ncbi:hypothetical protein Ab1vBOLIVR4_gp46 [Agrobacterium phage OLIVR4]|nr:hypothetical protein Ab1vBOLIVR4_gp46 [Agrobacterium phage OLIVR4]